jgi:orotidine-5'-phosphate decarboxylase
VVGRDFLLVTPGIRPVGGATGDQKRIMTPGEAIAGGADYLVIGRPVTEASDPEAAAAAIVGEMGGAKA